MIARRLMLAAVFSYITAPASAGPYDPRFTFTSIVTPHFIVHFHQGEELLAARMARMRSELLPICRGPLIVIVTPCCPTVRSAFGKSFGPMTMRATPPISITSPQLMSSMSSTVLLP